MSSDYQHLTHGDFLKLFETTESLNEVYTAAEPIFVTGTYMDLGEVHGVTDDGVSEIPCVFVLCVDTTSQKVQSLAVPLGFVREMAGGLLRGLNEAKTRGIVIPDVILP